MSRGESGATQAMTDAQEPGDGDPDFSELRLATILLTAVRRQGRGGAPAR
jgi:hypothetical protein